MRKRKYWTTKQSLRTFAPLAGFQALPADECARLLLSCLRSKAPCYKFLARGEVMPMTHNMVSTVHLLTDRKKIDLNLIAGCMPNTVIVFCGETFAVNFLRNHARSLKSFGYGEQRCSPEQIGIPSTNWLR